MATLPDAFVDTTRNFLKTKGKQTRKEIPEHVYRGKPKT